MGTSLGKLYHNTWVHIGAIYWGKNDIIYLVYNRGNFFYTSGYIKWSSNIMKNTKGIKNVNEKMDTYNILWK